VVGDWQTWKWRIILQTYKSNLQTKDDEKHRSSSILLHVSNLAKFHVIQSLLRVLVIYVSIVIDASSTFTFIHLNPKASPSHSTLPQHTSNHVEEELYWPRIFFLIQKRGEEA
jgi:hypothetical protein